MLFSEKENIFMCLIVFQNFFPKIFSSVWKMLQGKDKPRKTRTKPRLTLDAQLGSTAWCFASSSPMTAPSIMISRSTVPLREIAINGAILQSVDRDLAKHRAASRDRDQRFAISRSARSRDRDRRRDLAKRQS